MVIDTQLPFLKKLCWRGQRQRQKAMGLVSKTTTLHVHHTSLYISFRPCATKF